MHAPLARSGSLTLALLSLLLVAVSTLPACGLIAASQEDRPLAAQPSLSSSASGSAWASAAAARGPSGSRAARVETVGAAMPPRSLIIHAVPRALATWRRESELPDDECSRASRRARARRAGLAARMLSAAPSMQQCRDLPSAEAVCQCLARLSPTRATCELAELRTSHARLAYVRREEDEADVVSGSQLYLLASSGETGAPSWSALALADSSESVDLNETPRLSSSVELVHFEELPLAAATLFWVQSQHDVTDHDLGDYVERGESSLLLCTVPASGGSGEAVAGSCYPPLPLAKWSRTSREFSEEEDGGGREPARDGCAAGDVTAYRFQLDSTGRGALTLMRGKDVEKRAGSYQLR